jgi:hypothetical protein
MNDVFIEFKNLVEAELGYKTKIKSITDEPNLFGLMVFMVPEDQYSYVEDFIYEMEEHFFPDAKYGVVVLVKTVEITKKFYNEYYIDSSLLQGVIGREEKNYSQIPSSIIVEKGIIPPRPSSVENVLKPTIWGRRDGYIHKIKQEVTRNSGKHLPIAA